MNYRFDLKEVTAQCSNFSKVSARTQNPYRFGDKRIKTTKQIEGEIYINKLSEEAFKKFLFELGIYVEVDYNVYPPGEWNYSGVKYNGISLPIRVVGIKFFSDWLLVEKRSELYKNYVLVRVLKDWKSAEILGYCTLNQLKDNGIFRMGELLPGTKIKLDVDNYAMNEKELKNSKKDWEKLIKDML